MKSKNYTYLSKFLSYILRHHPEDCSLEMDREGSVKIGPLLECLRERGFKGVNRTTLHDLINTGEKRRFEIRGDKIRALYGHSVSVEMTGEFKPPEKLYHGTSPENLSGIRKNGLKSMGRKFVHLSWDRKEARKVGMRHHPSPIILTVKAGESYENGIKFYNRGDVILSEEIPSEFIIFNDRENNERRTNGRH